MEIFIVLAVFVLLTLAIMGAKKKSVKATQPPVLFDAVDAKTKLSIESEEEKKKELINSILKNIKIEVSYGRPASTDPSIIDVSGQSYQIPGTGSSGTTAVPYWPHFYVYSYEDINRATAEQKRFYQFFKESFLKGEYLDLGGNNNYAFILLFDLLNESDKQPTLESLEENLKNLALNYPRTQAYCKTFLLEKMQKRNDLEGVMRVNNDYNYQYAPYENEYTYYRLGSRYKQKLNLSSEQEDLVNKLYHPGNNFCSIEFCLLQAIRLYLLVTEQLNLVFTQQNSNLHNELGQIAGIVATKQFKYKVGSFNYNYAVGDTRNDLYRLLFKYTENALREYYGHKRKISTDISYHAIVKTELEEKLLSKLPELFSKLLPQIQAPDEPTELALNEQNTSRWKTALEKIKEDCTSDGRKFLEAVLRLGELNRKNPSVENIFYEASKHIAKTDREVSLTLYVHYLYWDLKSASFDHKQLTKTIQKCLFKTNEELHGFEKIIGDLIKDKDLDKAISAVSSIYAPRRKKIKLDAAVISEVRQRHSDTVDTLGELLEDEYEDESSTIKSHQVSGEEVEISITQKSEATQTSEAPNRFGLTPVQLGLLGIFLKHSFNVPDEDMEVYTRTKGMFKSQLVDSINEACYEELDDNLIEEEDGSFVINEQYYQRIIAS